MIACEASQKRLKVFVSLMAVLLFTTPPSFDLIHWFFYL